MKKEGKRENPTSVGRLRKEEMVDKKNQMRARECCVDGGHSMKTEENTAMGGEKDALARDGEGMEDRKR